ncbi:MAG: preprotein translocase subunit SecG [Mucinivorans sp.]
MYILFIVLILFASVVLVLTVLAQSPKSGMAANFGASNQVMGVRQTADFLEKLTWGLSIAIVVLSLCATMAIPREDIDRSNAALEDARIENTMPADVTQGLPEVPAAPAADSAK